jgi:hypothetical protein
MQSLRGAEAGARIAAGKAYVLAFDVVLPSVDSASYEVEIVDRLGSEVRRANAAVRDGRLTAALGKLSRGAYWVRVYRLQGGKELLAEYGLDAE